MRVLLVLLLILGVSAPARAASDADQTAIQNIIERQLQAFSADDAATAYSFAAPGIKAMFPTEDIFMEMVRRGYPQVYRPRSHAFGELKESSTGLQQYVDIVDDSGVGWTAVYTVAQQPDGTWKITGCYIIEKPGESV